MCFCPFLDWLAEWQRILSAPQFCKFDFIILTCSAAKKCWNKCVGRSSLNVHCHLAVKLSERASFNKFNKNFKIWHFQHENILDKLETLGRPTFNYSWYSVEWSEVAHLRHFEINPAGSFISWCKNPQIVNHLQMLRVLELPAQLAGSSYLRLRLHLVFNLLGLLAADQEEPPPPPATLTTTIFHSSIFPFQPWLCSGEK